MSYNSVTSITTREVAGSSPAIPTIENTDGI